MTLEQVADYLSLTNIVEEISTNCSQPSLRTTQVIQYKIQQTQSIVLC